MLTARHQASALCVSRTPYGILVVRGRDASRMGLRTAELLCNQLGLSGKDIWRWRTLSPMLEPCSARPGVLLLADLEYTQRVLVAGGTRDVGLLKSSSFIITTAQVKGSGLSL